jgi:peroxiredoxin
MAQLCHDYPKFKALNTEILVMVPNGPKMIEKYTIENRVPYQILSDKGSRIAAQYFQLKRFFSLGTPTVFLVDRSGKFLYTHYANSLIEEPDNREPLEILAKLTPK